MRLRHLPWPPRGRAGGRVSPVDIWRALLAGALAAFTLAAVYGGVLLATHRASRTSQLPLGPFILLGALAGIAFL